MAIPLGNLIIRYLLHGVSQTISTLFVRVQVDTLALSATEIVFSFVVTVGISILAAYQPAREAMQVHPKKRWKNRHWFLKIENTENSWNMKLKNEHLT